MPAVTRNMGEQARSAPRADAASGQAGRVVAVLMYLIAFYYVGYRYPLQIGDGLLSPTYSATPIWLQLGKYVALALLFGLGWYRLRTHRGFETLESVIAVFSGLVLLSCFAFAFYDLPIAIRLAEVGFIPLMALVFTAPANIEMKATFFIRVATWFFWLNILAYVIQFALFWFVGRLPGLAFGGATTRFGGIWDDPNSALAPFLLYVPYYLARNGLTKMGFLLVLLTILSIILSQSGTSLVSFVVMIAAVLVFLASRWSAAAKRRIVVTSVVSAVMMLAVGVLVSLGDFIDIGRLIRSLDETIRMKGESIDIRADSYSVLSRVDLLTLLGVNPVFGGGENQFVNVLVNFGLVPLLMFIFINVLTLKYIFDWTRLSVTRESYAISVACYCYYVWYFSSMLNLPKAEVFPVNLLAAIVAGLAIASRRKLLEVHRQSRVLRGIKANVLPFKINLA